MKITHDLEEINEILNTYNGDTARIWLFDITHTRLAIKIMSGKSEEVIYLVMVNCEYMKGPFRVSSPKLFVSRGINKETLEGTFIVEDGNTDFQLIGNGGVVLAKGKESEFGDSFENFLKE